MGRVVFGLKFWPKGIFLGLFMKEARIFLGWLRGFVSYVI